MDPEPQVVKEATCPSLSHLSTLTYQVGKAPDGICFRVINSTGNGFFSSEWVSQKAILAVLEEETFIWSALFPLFHGKSVNTACFLMAVLLAEGLVQPSREKPRRYELADLKEFMAKMDGQRDKPKKGGKRPPPEIVQPDLPSVNPLPILRQTS